MLPGMCPLSSRTSPLFYEKDILVPFWSTLKPLKNSTAQAGITEDTAACSREDVQSLCWLAWDFGAVWSSLCHSLVPASRNIRQVGPRGSWSCPAEGRRCLEFLFCHSQPYKERVSFFSFPVVLCPIFLLCCLRESQRSVFQGSRWGQQIQMMLDADMEAAVALGALTEHHSC